MRNRYPELPQAGSFQSSTEFAHGSSSLPGLDPAHAGCIPCPGCSGWRHQAIGVELVGCLRLAPPHQIDRRVERDAMDPGIEIGLAAKLVAEVTVQIRD